METNLYNPFLEATRNVFQLMLDMTDITERPADEFSSEDGLDISVGVIGDLEGEVVYSFPRNTSLSMVGIMSGMEVDAVDEFVTSAISEMTNIISGNVMTTLAENDVKCDILPPAVSREGADVQHTLRADCCIGTAAGDVRLDIRLSPAKED